MDAFGEESVVIPDVPEPIVGWREWSIGWDQRSPALRSPSWPWPVGEESRLQSGFNYEVWQPGRRVVAGCPHAHPDRTIEFTDGVGRRVRWFPSSASRARMVVCEHCPSPTADGHAGYGCGIYSYKTPDRYGVLAPPVSRAWGRIQIFGEVWEHALGYRSQYAELTGIAVPHLFARRAPAWPSSSHQLIADYLAGLVLLGLIYRVPMLVPVEGSAHREMRERMKQSAAAILDIPPDILGGPTDYNHWSAWGRGGVGTMADDLLEVPPLTLAQIMRDEWGYEPTDAWGRVKEAERQERDLKAMLAHMNDTAVMPMNAEQLRKILDECGVDFGTVKGENDG